MRIYARLTLAAAVVAAVLGAQADGANAFRAGAYAVDITPPKFPVIVNGMFLERIAEKAHDRIYARCLVMDDGAVRLAMVVVDSCMVPRDLLDRAKKMAQVRSGIPVERMLISATHTHSAPAAMGCLGTDADPDYVKFLPERLAEGIVKAAQDLKPARAGWGVIDDHDHTHCRRWIFRLDKMRTDPFGAVSVRANMHPGYQNADAIAPSGPVDPGISLLSIQSQDGKPLALLANYSMHYFGSPFVSSDYYGLFATDIARRIGAGSGNGPFVAMMSQGTSGDQMWMDYSKPKTAVTLEAYAAAVTDVVYRAYQKIQYRTPVTLAMAEAKLTLKRRVPDIQRLAWARQLLAQMPAAKPRNQPEVYAREQIFLHEDPVRELKLQALRIGDLGITAIPNEVFAITGLKLKAQSPLRPTFNIELANGAEGYIPPPEQHKLGGYTTWPARTAALEIDAEPRIVETLLALLEKVAGRPRRQPNESKGPYAKTVLSWRPAAYWRMNDFSGSHASDETGRNPGRYLDGVAFYLPGLESPQFSGKDVNRAVHLAGGRLAAIIDKLGPTYSVEMWFWNGLPNDARDLTGHLFTRAGDKLSIGGRAAPGRLLFAHLSGRTEIAMKTWHHVILVRDGRKIGVYLNGEPEISGHADPTSGDELFVGGQADSSNSFEGKIDEVAVYRRALKQDEIARRFKGLDFRRLNSIQTAEER
jgi:hypothetical protein